MKPKAPKKKDTKPSAKSGEVVEDKVIERITLNLDWTKNNLYNSYWLHFDIRLIEDKFFYFND